MTPRPPRARPLEPDEAPSIPGPAAFRQPAAPAISLAIPGPALSATVEFDEVEVEVEELADDAFDAESEVDADPMPREQTDGFYLPAELSDRPTRFPTGNEGPSLGPVMARPSLGPVMARPTLAGPSLAAGPALAPAAGDPPSLGDGWFGNAVAPSVPLAGPATGPATGGEPPMILTTTVDVDADAEELDEDPQPLRIPPLQISLAQRVAPVSIAMMVVSLTVWTAVQIWT